jgi:ribosome-associated protein
LKKIHPLINELNFKAIRSSGPGGQHANKVSSKIELSFDVLNSKGLTEEQKQLLLKNIANRLTKENVLILQCDESRSQHNNKEIVIKRFLQLIEKGLIIPKKRKPTKPTKASVRKRLDGKKKLSIKKSGRKSADLDL